MSAGEIQQLVFGAIQGLLSSTLFVLVLFIGFCVVVGLTKLKKTRGGDAAVVKSLDERVTHRSFEYMSPDAPHGPADQLRAPELMERR